MGFSTKDWCENREEQRKQTNSPDPDLFVAVPFSSSSFDRHFFFSVRLSFFLSLSLSLLSAGLIT